MNGERLFRILGWVDEDLIEEADTASSPAASGRSPGPWGWVQRLLRSPGRRLWRRQPGRRLRRRSQITKHTDQRLFV